MALYNAEPQHRYCGRLARTTQVTTRHVRNIVTILEEMKLVSREPSGRIKYITLTDTGQELAEMLLRIYPTLR